MQERMRIQTVRKAFKEEKSRVSRIRYNVAQLSKALALTFNDFSIFCKELEKETADVAAITEIICSLAGKIDILKREISLHEVYLGDAVRKTKRLRKRLIFASNPQRR